MMRRAWALVLFALAGCGTGGEGCVTLAAGAPDWCLLPPAQGPVFEVLSEIELRQGEGSEIFLAQVENDPSSLSAALLTPLGQRLASVQWQGGRIARESVGGSRSFDPGALLALVQLARWPLTDLTRVARTQGLDFAEAENRRVLQDEKGRVLVQISANHAHLVIHLPQSKLALRIRDLPVVGEAP